MLSNRAAWYQIVLRCNTLVFIIFNAIGLYHNISPTLTCDCIVNRYIAIQCIMLQYIVLYYKVLLLYDTYHFMLLYQFIQFSLFSNILHFMQFVANYFKLHCIVLLDNISHYITLYHFISHYIAWCCTI